VVGVRAMTPLLLAGSLLLAACAGGTTSAADTRIPTAGTRTSTDVTRTQPDVTRTPTVGTPAPVKVVVLDAGHNGENGSHPAEINRLVPAGRGQTKPCNTTGTSTDAGYTEHEFTFDVAQRVGQALSAKGFKVVYTRPDDHGVGPCVDKRAEIGNAANADAVVSIHADGSNSAGAHGFHVAYSSPPLNAAQGEPSTKLAKTLRDTLRANGFSTANYIGADGLAPRDDLAGLNLSTRPAALVECGNMRDAAEAALMTTADGRQRYAAAIASAIETYLA
jgi:N-acetylmuramoyl-L-alanine amidase